MIRCQGKPDFRHRYFVNKIIIEQNDEIFSKLFCTNEKLSKKLRSFFKESVLAFLWDGILFCYSRENKIRFEAAQDDSERELHF